MQIRNEPFFFVAIVIWFTQSVGSSTGVITPSLTSLFSSALTGCSSSMGILFAGRVVGVASGSTVKWTGPGRVPTSSQNTSGNWSFISLGVCATDATASKFL